mgnify:CR=1 FL=1
MRLRTFLAAGLLALGAEPTRLPVDPRDALLDRGSSMGFIPLASPAAAFMTGVVLPVDGGYLVT